MKKVINTLVLASLLVFSNANANLVVNGGFEEPSLPYQTWGVFQNIPGWSTTSGAGIEVQNNVAGDPYEGFQFVELDSNYNSSMEQLIDTVAGEHYTLSFFYSPRPGEKTGTNNILIGWGNHSLGAITDSGKDNENTVWQQYTYDVIGTGLGTSLNFRAVGVSDSFGGYIDNVVLTSNSPVPEPATILLFGAGVMGLASRMRRNSKV